MLLHAHPVNQAREAAGLLVANGLWAWGGGEIKAELSRSSATERLAFEGDSPLVAGANAWCRTTNRESVDQTVWLYDAAERALMQGDAGAWLAAIESFEENAAKQWVEKLKTSNATVELRVGEGMAWQVDSYSRWRFWRRSQPLRDLIQVRD